MAELEMRAPGRRWFIPYEIGQLVRYKLYDTEKVMEVVDKQINYVSLRNIKNQHDRFRCYEHEIDNYLEPI